VLKRYKFEQDELKTAQARKDAVAQQAAKNEINTLVLSKHNLATLLRRLLSIALCRPRIRPTG
jgi:hypothetical protein